MNPLQKLAGVDFFKLFERERQRKRRERRLERERQEAAYVLGLKPHVSLTPYHWPSKPSKGLLFHTHIYAHAHTHAYPDLMHNLEHVQEKIFFINESL